MNKKQEEEQTAAVLAISAVGIAGIAIYVAKTISEKRKRAKIQADADRQIEAIHRSGDIVKAKILAGDYDGTPLRVMFDDFEFYKIVDQY